MKDSLIVVEAKISLDANHTLPERGYVVAVTKEKKKSKQVSAYLVGTKDLCVELRDRGFSICTLKMRPWFKLQYLEFIAEFSALNLKIRRDVESAVIVEEQSEGVTSND